MSKKQKKLETYIYPNQIIQNEKPEFSKKEIINQLKRLSLKCVDEGYTSKSIDVLNRTKYWVKAKELLIEYYTEGHKKPLFCSICNRKINKRITIHHTSYPYMYFFLPKYCTLVHAYCHVRFHKGYFFETSRI